MKVIKYPAKEEWSEIVKRPHLDVSKLNATIQETGLSNLPETMLRDLVAKYLVR